MSPLQDLCYTSSSMAASGCRPGHRSSSINKRKIPSIDVTKYDVSNIANGRVYAVSKTEEMQGMRNIERSCDLIGGYVAEIDSVAEQMFLTNFLQMTSNYGYYIGVVRSTQQICVRGFRGWTK
ncbi:hypothetical protein PoB_003140900 [Plakobranchus ocellatus]|uniref:Uncharacterized protein n=1 Tax=Plakobranchus ocellatus TaxID=259542 RepID=A0AAV4AF73_9GAST|nr:hypothetical protein PoB_003140900 [Plakobranchus ocellatus]